MPNFILQIVSKMQTIVKSVSNSRKQRSVLFFFCSKFESTLLEPNKNQNFEDDQKEAIKRFEYTFETKLPDKVIYTFISQFLPFLNSRFQCNRLCLLIIIHRTQQLYYLLEMCSKNTLFLQCSIGLYGLWKCCIIFLFFLWFRIWTSDRIQADISGLLVMSRLVFLKLNYVFSPRK